MISVVITVYNRLELLPRTMRSVLNQTYGNLEIIVVDDGSSEDVKSVLDKIDDNRICYIRHNMNRGVAAARNTAIKAAHGKYVTFLDSDDEWSEKKIERQIVDLSEHGTEKRVSYCLSEIYLDSESKVLKQRTFSLEGDILHQLLCGCVIGLNSIMLPREFMPEVGEFDERLKMHSDWEFLIRLSSHFRFSCVREILNRDHWHELPQITKTYSLAPIYDQMIYDRNRALFEADKEANGNFFLNLAFYAGVSGKKKEAVKLIARSISINPITRKPYLALALLATNRLKKPTIIR